MFLWLVTMALLVHCGLGQLSPLPTSGDDKWVSAKHYGRAKRSGISDTHRLRWSLQFRYINNQSLRFYLCENSRNSWINDTLTVGFVHQQKRFHLSHKTQFEASYWIVLLIAPRDYCWIDWSIPINRSIQIKMVCLHSTYSMLYNNSVSKMK